LKLPASPGRGKPLRPHRKSGKADIQGYTPYDPIEKAGILFCRRESIKNQSTVNDHEDFLRNNIVNIHDG
jgi:hypothetical protein